MAKRKGKDWSKRTRPLSREEYARRIRRGEEIPARLAPPTLPMGTYGVQPGANKDGGLFICAPHAHRRFSSDISRHSGIMVFGRLETAYMILDQCVCDATRN